jgi:TolB protein
MSKGSDHGSRRMSRRASFKFRFLAAMIATMFAATLVAAPPAPDDYVQRIMIANPDGSGMKPLVDLPEYKRQGSPTWSKDGKLIAFDAWRPQTGEKAEDAKVIVVNADGSNPRVLGDGAKPSFSPQANRIVFVRYNNNPGVWVMSSAGPDKECVLLDGAGHGADWSPDGTRIVYSTADRQGANLIVYDLVEGTREPMFDADTANYRLVWWNFKWSPDGNKIAFKGMRLDGNPEMAIVDARGAKHGIVSRFDGNVKKIQTGFTYRPDGKQILFSCEKAGPGARMQIHSIDPNANDPPERVAWQDPLRAYTYPAYSPDGTKIAFACSPAAKEKKDGKTP